MENVSHQMLKDKGLTSGERHSFEGKISFRLIIELTPPCRLPQSGARKIDVRFSSSLEQKHFLSHQLP
jgi:hypothetical protein